MTRPSPEQMYVEMAALGQALHWGPNDLMDLEHDDRRRWLAQLADHRVGG
ncbi:MAG: hypothetical protein JWQ20_4085 [Conexibacter sp.]|nr:hypothetical protein [Solirubrobacterales bacterium]MCW3004787.1 hypothetical protein [Conexibacter sp.]